MRSLQISKRFLMRPTPGSTRMTKALLFVPAARSAKDLFCLRRASV